MKKLLIVIINFLLISSIKANDNIDYEFKEYSNDFVWFLESNIKNNKIKNRIKTIKIKFGKIEDYYYNNGISGFCYYQINTVIFDKERWKKLPEEVKQEAVDHELSHCILGMIHNENYIVSQFMNKPESIMFPNFFPYNLLLNKDDYRKQLIKNKKEFFKLDKLSKDILDYRHKNNGLYPY